MSWINGPPYSWNLYNHRALDVWQSSSVIEYTSEPDLSEKQASTEKMKSGWNTIQYSGYYTRYDWSKNILRRKSKQDVVILEHTRISTAGFYNVCL